jgi:hypothetical protein
MPELIKDEKCSICSDRATARYPNFVSFDDDWDFRQDISLNPFLEYESDLWLHQVKFKKTLFWGVNALICGYCRKTLDSLNEFHIKKSSISDRKWYSFWGDTTKVINKPLTKAFKNIDSLREKIAAQKKLIRDAVEKSMEKKNREAEERQRVKQKQAEREKERLNKLKKSIIKILKEKALKMPASDIDARLKHQDVDEIKELCEEMYHNGKISRTANYRYFILTEEQEKPKTTSAPKPEKVDVKAELKKYKEMLDEGLITQEQYDAKSNELLGL